MKRVAIIQSNYLPWKGYFDIIDYVDEFIIFDDMQFTKRDWRNRNKIKTPSGTSWLTVPVLTKGKYHQKINETLIDHSKAWQQDHLKAIQLNYSKSPYFGEIIEILSPAFTSAKTFTHLTDLNVYLIKLVCKYLNIDTKISFSTDFSVSQGKSERLASICHQAGASVYVSGPAAMDYLDQRYFQKFLCQVEWFDYSNYPLYPQCWGEFVHPVSIIDVLFNCGPTSRDKAILSTIKNSI